MNPKTQTATVDAFGELLKIIVTLRGPLGCPWDKEQTVKTLRGDLLEETYECIDAINKDDDDNLREELGDLFLLTAMISYIKEQEKTFTIETVLNEVCSKLVRRHPHVFAGSQVSGSDEVLEQWDKIKREVEGKHGNGSILNTVPATLPPLEKAYRLQKKAAKAGFDWRDRSDVFDKVLEEINELKAIGDGENKGAWENELGDLLFAVVNLCRHFSVDPTIALHGANGKFTKRFNYIEKNITSLGKTLSKDEFDLMDKLWDEAKSLEK